MLRAYYVYECALLLQKLTKSGYKRVLLLHKLKRHLIKYPDVFGDTGYLRLYDAILAKLDDPQWYVEIAP